MAQRSGATIKIELCDEHGEPILTWRPGSNNIAIGIKKACELATEKLGVDLKDTRKFLNESERKKAQKERDKLGAREDPVPNEMGDTINLRDSGDQRGNMPDPSSGGTTSDEGDQCQRSEMHGFNLPRATDAILH